MKDYKIYQIVLILAPFVFSFAFGLDIYIPIVPEMSKLFSTTPSLVQLTLSLFLFTTGAGQLVIGPLSDQYGRKAILYLSALFYAAGAVGCALSWHIYVLIAARLVSSLGACGLLVTSFALVRDLFSKEKSAEMYGFLNGAIGISPTFAPILGGYLAFYLGWQSIFLFLALIGILSLFITGRFIEETHPLERRVKVDCSIFKRYGELFSNRDFAAYSSLAGLAEGVFFCFFSISPFLIIDRLGVPLHSFGYYFAAFGAVIGLGGLASGKLIRRVGAATTIGTGIFLMFFGGAVMLSWHFLADLSLQGFLLPMVIACTGAIFVVGGAASGALEPFGVIAGTASAAFGAVEFALSALIGSLLMLFPATSTLPYATAIILIALASTLSFSLVYGKEVLQADIPLLQEEL